MSHIYAREFLHSDATDGADCNHQCNLLSRNRLNLAVGRESLPCSHHCG